MENILSNSLAVLSILATIIGVIVALSVAFNFYSIYAYNKKLEDIEERFNKFSQKVEKEFTQKTDSLNHEIASLKELKLNYANINYEIYNSNATLKYETKHIFEAILIEFKNIDHILNHIGELKDKYKEYIGAKCYFIANDLMKYQEDVFVINDDKINLKYLQEQIIIVSNRILESKDCNYDQTKEKIKTLSYSVRDLLGILISEEGSKRVEAIEEINWNKVSEISR